MDGEYMTEESEEFLEIARELIRQLRPHDALPFLTKALEDPLNLDASITLADISPTPRALEVLEEAVAKGRNFAVEWFGPNVFADDGQYVGHLWGVHEMRPFMRALHALALKYFEANQNPKCTEIWIELLRLSSNDNMGTRTCLGSALIRDGRYTDALSFAQNWLKPPRGSSESHPPHGGTVFATPTQDLLSNDDEVRLTKLAFVVGELAYTAALASFKVFGDCPLSTQYLRMASKINPHIILRIIGRVRQPNGLYEEEQRGMNGPEDAIDYLWLTQDLWMENSVWNWVNGNQDAKQATVKISALVAFEFPTAVPIARTHIRGPMIELANKTQ
ncbi:hypothetical protein D9611_000725 [Ephemerocybe angulata]|uniref:Uncharacterized protein n=1 Tax=Ephemerocybe angulata TaxID=980116 RepID=A0A8H5BNF5_9AGAR|nr:hypothetical protein D9611_000725 [Tulosesus angulatus]